MEQKLIPLTIQSHFQCLDSIMHWKECETNHQLKGKRSTLLVLFFVIVLFRNQLYRRQEQAIHVCMGMTHLLAEAQLNALARIAY